MQNSLHVMRFSFCFRSMKAKRKKRSEHNMTCIEVIAFGIFCHAP